MEMRSPQRHITLGRFNDGRRNSLRIRVGSEFPTYAAPSGGSKTSRLANSAAALVFNSDPDLVSGPQ